MREKIAGLINKAVKELYSLDIRAEIDRPEEEFGDYYTNVALKLSGQLQKNAPEIAAGLAAKLKADSLFSDVSVAGPGFVNFSLNSAALLDLINSQPAKVFAGQVVVAEYSDPNPFKVLHAGHLYTSIIGDAIANLIESAGAKVHRVNFGGDIGLHVAKTIWAILKDLDGENPQKLDDIKKDKRSEWLSGCYVRGNEAYEEGNEEVKSEIRELNKRLFDISLNNDHASPLAIIYWTCRTWSYEYLESFYGRVGIKFKKYYPESEVAELGIQTVKAHIPDVYQESQGAVIFAGEKYGLYSNVFINSQGLPTYAAKDVGLLMQKWQDYHYDRSVIITASEQADYLRVVLKSISLFDPDPVEKTTHITHGIVKLAGGQKMSSRKGNIVSAMDILDLAKEAAKAKEVSSGSEVTIGAVKYAFVRQRIGGDIIYDAKESVSLEGNSGTYLQYAYARAMSIFNKAEPREIDLKTVDSFTEHELALLRKLSSYSEIVELAVKELKPHHLANYLYNLAQTFNRFYENSRVVGDERQDIRLKLVKLYADKLATGLKLLGIQTLEKM